jgi:predicted deacylase
VKAGDELARIRDLWGRPTAVVQAPEGGVLVTERRVQSVNVGDNLFTILVPTGESA